jgi:hypothetical protein
MKYYRGYRIIFIFSVFFLWFAANSAKAQEKINTAFFMRFRIVEPAGSRFRVNSGGYRHNSDPSWYLPEAATEVAGGEWSAWFDLSNYPLHGRLDRSGGIAEFPSIRLSAARLDSGEPVKNCKFSVQLADKPDEKSVVVSFDELSESNTIVFLAPVPLRKNAKDFETGTQMTARHARWAKEATGGRPIRLKKFNIITSLWGHYDQNLAQREAATLQTLGFNVVGNVDLSILQKLGMKTAGHTWLYEPDPESVARQWKTFTPAEVEQQLKTNSHWTIADEVSVLDFRNVEKTKLNNWFRAFLKSKGATDADFAVPIDRVEYPAAAMFEATLPQDAPLQTRRLMYYAGKFGQFWSAKQLRQTSDLIGGSLPGMPTETLLPSHGFLGNAWGPANIGMSYRMHDIFELGAQESLSQLSAEDWLGLNHMYGPEYTWSGAQTFSYFNALVRSAIGDKPILQRGLITPSDDAYLRLKAYSALGQGAKSLFFWTFGPTMIGTENYWSDLRSEYDGIAKLNRALEKSEDVLYPAKPVTDSVAILYSVSHDIWNTNNQAAFVEKRLLWHALRHLQIQPNFLREDDVDAGKLKNYKVLYITDWCIARKTSAAIDEWVKSGGTLYLSAGAATRDEFYEPYSPPFASAIWGENAALRLVNEQHKFNERTDLPNIKSLTNATVRLNERQFNLPVIGSRLDMRPNAKPLATFADGR